jgi:tetratricopeptide (TPR) repeat protein
VRGTILSLRLVCATLVSAAICGGQDATPENSVIARLNGAITPSGILQADMTVTAAGAPSSPYRGELMRTAGAASLSLFGGFLRGRHLPPVAQVTDADQPDRPVQIRFRFQEEDFLLPIQREQSLALDLIPMSSSLAAAPGLFREEISLAVPQNFTARGSNVNAGNAFARYQSVAKMEGPLLVIARELVVNPRPDRAASQAEMDSFWKIVREDHQKLFILHRTIRSDPSQWIQSVSLAQANRYGALAYPQREYEAARQLFGRAIRLQPKDSSAWNNLGRALAALGELEQAQKAYETQISINPLDRYAYNNLGLVQERQSHWDAAVASLLKQIEVHPGDSYAVANLPRALIHAGRWPEVEAAASPGARYEAGQRSAESESCNRTGLPRQSR